MISFSFALLLVLLLLLQKRLAHSGGVPHASTQLSESYQATRSFLRTRIPSVSTMGPGTVRFERPL